MLITSNGLDVPARKECPTQGFHLRHSYPNGHIVSVLDRCIFMMYLFPNVSSVCSGMIKIMN